MLKYIILKLIEFIEWIQYRNIKKNDLELLNKFVDVVFPKNLFVETDYGIVPVEEINVTTPYTIYRLELENGMWLECADNHLLFLEDYSTKCCIDLTTSDMIQTKDGLSRVKSVIKLNHKVSMFDLSIDSPEQSFYSNGILSHNTVSASIVLLWYALFNNDFGILVIANSTDTIKEIILKIQNIYKLLPFYLKTGIVNWNQRGIALQNGSRIHTATASKTGGSGVGLAINCLYFDEFAKVENQTLKKVYGTVIPTVSSIVGSKVMITSTPDGFNLFWELVTGAEKDENDPLKNEYSAMRVYWWQVPGRRDTKLYPNKKFLEKYNLTWNDVHNELYKIGYTNIYEEKESEKKTAFKIPFDLDNEITHLEYVRGIRIRENIPLIEICKVTNWEEQETVTIGGFSMFQQEYGLQFITGSKLLFDSATIERMQSQCSDFIFHPFDNFDKKLKLPYNNLKWIENKPELFDLASVKKYYIILSLDVGEGLGKDYSVINIFRLMPKELELIKKIEHKLSNVYDYLKIEQIGLFRSNVFSTKELAELFYMISFELFDPEKVKVVLEYNTFGSDFLTNCRHVFEDNNEFSDSVFLRYKHNMDDKLPKIGLKVKTGDTAGKKLLVKDYQDASNKHSIELHHDMNLLELKVFGRKETPSGDYTYKSETGNDDIIMTCVDVTTAFKNTMFKNMMDAFLEFEVTPDFRQLVENAVHKKDTGTVVDYSSFLSAKRSGVGATSGGMYGNNNNRKPVIDNPWNRS